MNKSDNKAASAVATMCSNKNGERQIRIVRYLVFISLLGAAVLCAAVSYVVLHQSEASSYEDHYDAMTKQMISSVEEFLDKYHATTKQLALIASIRYPNESSWPFVGISDFYKLDQSIVNVTGASSANSILPIVPTEQLDEFNAYAKDFLAGEEYVHSYPQIYSAYNLGVWDIIDGIPREITDGNTPDFDFEARDLITPVINPPVSIISSGLALVNLHALKQAAIAMDDVLSCTEIGFQEDCSSMSGYLLDTQYAAVSDTNIYTPIFCPQSPDHVLGFATSGFNWRNELKRLILSTEIDGIHCILSSIEQPSGNVTAEFTFLLKDGEAKYQGAGDRHDSKYSDMGKSTPIYLKGSQAQLSVHFRLFIYPTNIYEESFYTDTPLYTAIGLASMIVFTSLIFFVYDHLMNEDVKEKTAILRMKRDFVRFISHEIRTPLNTVSVGLQLLYEGLILQHGGEPMVVEDMMDLTSDVQSSTILALSVLNDLLHFDKLEAGELQIAHDQVCIWEAVKLVVKSFRIPANQKQVAVDLVFDNCVDEFVTKRQLVVTGDKFKISQVIRNMMSNALKFTPDGGSITVSMKWTKAPPVEVPQSVSSRWLVASIVPEASYYTGRDIVTITVTDTGHGLTEEQLGMLFRDGVQFNPNELQAGQGSGLGLYLSRAIVGMHGGKMWATSKGKDQGASFGVQFPTQVDKSSPYTSLDSTDGKVSILPPNDKSDTNAMSRNGVDLSVFSSREAVVKRKTMRVDALNDSNDKLLGSVMNEDCSTASVSPLCAMDEVATAAKMTSGGNAPLHQGRILVVDDASSNRKIVCKMLTKRGFECVEAKDGREGVDAVIGKGDVSYFDCILMDFEMPIMNGPDATAELRRLGYNIPIFGLTGNVMVDDVEYFLSKGANHVMAKPFQVSEFISLLRLARDDAEQLSKCDNGQL